jgi:two-component system sensor histidine kinase/response regulator
MTTCPPPVAVDASVLDTEGTLANLGGDAGLLRELLQFFADLAPGQVRDLGDAVAAGDVAAVDLHAHSLKGAAANVGAVALADAARALEMLAKGGGLAGADALVAGIADRLDETLGAIADLAASWPA